MKRIREMPGVQQDVRAAELGDDWNQQKIFILEQKEELDLGILDQVAKALKVTLDAIKDFNEGAAYNIVGNTVTNNDNVRFFSI